MCSIDFDISSLEASSSPSHVFVSKLFDPLFLKHSNLLLSGVIWSS